MPFLSLSIYEKFSENIACRGKKAASVLTILKGPDRSYTTVAP